MRKEGRTICFDEDLQLEAYHFYGHLPEFPNHFHDYYVIGYIVQGRRHLQCKNQTYCLNVNDIFLFQPQDNHGCRQVDDELFEFCTLHIPSATMQRLHKEITGQNTLPGFHKNVICDDELIHSLHTLHPLIMENSKEFSKEETLLLLVSRLLELYGQPFHHNSNSMDDAIHQVCTYMDQHFNEPISLEALCKIGNISKSTLLRAFTKAKGVTPYRYLQTIRINQAKQYLEQGHAPSAVALMTGFSDQSHFTNFFTLFIGISPAAYQAIFIKEIV